jgi:hypothetical protein
MKSIILDSVDNPTDLILRSRAKWARLGNINAAFVALFNKLSQHPPFARYGNKNDRPPMPDQESFEVVQAVIERSLERVGKATGRPLNPKTPKV